MVTLEKEGKVFILNMPILLNPTNIAQINSELDTVEKNPGPTALILASKHPSTFNMGLDSDYIRKEGARGFFAVYTDLAKLIARLLHYGVPSICVISGQVKDGGVLIAMAADYRIIGETAGEIKINDIKLGFPIPRALNLVLKYKLKPTTHRDLMLNKAFCPQEAVRGRVVDYSSKDPLQAAKELANELADFGDNKVCYRLLKYTTYQSEIDTANKAEVTEEERHYFNKIIPKL